MQCLTDIKLTKWPKMLAKGLLFEMFWNLASDYNTSVDKYYQTMAGDESLY